MLNVKIIDSHVIVLHSSTNLL